MKTAHVLRDMQKAFKDADDAFHQGNYEGSVECYNKALQLCQSLPSDTEFDKARFEASCYAGLSGAYGRWGKHLEGFAAANKALIFYDQHGESCPADTGRWLMAQVNQGTALAALGCFDQAIEALLRAKEIFVNKGLDTAENKQWLEMVDGNVAAITAHLKELQR
ncbi:MAG: tetratricopeptide repeat protein [Candidatus Bathyarchaeota archaeon]|nr:tetratricopeptide repeat protein [Candidatus Bathyarchaeota archaeon]